MVDRIYKIFQDEQGSLLLILKNLVNPVKNWLGHHIVE
jgi:hypothetical protein